MCFFLIFAFLCSSFEIYQSYGNEIQELYNDSITQHIHDFATKDPSLQLHKNEFEKYLDLTFTQKYLNQLYPMVETVLQEAKLDLLSFDNSSDSYIKDSAIQLSSKIQTHASRLASNQIEEWTIDHATLSSQIHKNIQKREDIMNDNDNVVFILSALGLAAMEICIRLPIPYYARVFLTIIWLVSTFTFADQLATILVNLISFIMTPRSS